MHASYTPKYTHRQCCGAGQFVDAEARTTHACAVCDPTTMACSDGGQTVATIPLLQGFWRESLQISTIRRCWNKDACIGGAPSVSAAAAAATTAATTGAVVPLSDTDFASAAVDGAAADTTASVVDAYCAAGYKGPYCAVCSADYASLGRNTCVSCKDSASVVGFTILRFLVAAALLAACSMLALKYYKEQAKDAAVGSISAGDSAMQLLLSTSAFEHYTRKAAAVCAKIFKGLRIQLVVYQRTFASLLYTLTATLCLYAHMQHKEVITEFVRITGAKMPEMYRNFLQKLSFVNFDMGWLLPVGCYISIGESRL
eukprot:828-Heterococcus_DN1.PRE.6